MIRTGVMAAAAVITLSTATARAQSTPSLGELARQTAEKRAASKPAGKVYTNSDLARDSRDVAPETSTQAAAAAGGGYVSKSTGEVLTAEQILANSQEKLARDSAKMDEKYWRNQAASLRKELQNARDAVNAYQTAQPSTAAMRQITAKELVKSEKVLADLEKRWSNLEESARYANIPNAWLQP